MTGKCPGLDCQFNTEGECTKEKVDHDWGTKYEAPGLIVCVSFQPRGGPVIANNGSPHEIRDDRLGMG